MDQLESIREQMEASASRREARELVLEQREPEEAREALKLDVGVIATSFAVGLVLGLAVALFIRFREAEASEAK